MEYLIDSDAVIDFLVGDDAAVALFRDIVPRGIAVSALTLGDLLDSASLGPDPDAFGASLDRALAGMHILSFDEDVARRFATLRLMLREDNGRLSDGDLIVAATAIFHDLTLISRFPRWFGLILDLRLMPVHSG